MNWTINDLDVSLIAGVLPYDLGFWEIKKVHIIEEHLAAIEVKIGLFSNTEKYGDETYCNIDRRIAQLSPGKEKIFGTDLQRRRLVDDWEVENRSGFNFLIFKERIRTSAWDLSFDLGREKIIDIINMLLDLICRYNSIEISKGSKDENISTLNIF